VGEAVKPGRELDAIIGEKVMNRKPIPCVCTMQTSCPACDGNGGYLHYSTDIAAAWEVVEHAVFDAWAIGRTSGGKYEVFNPWTDNATVSIADTAPHAICLAALEAVDA
jgi:hypothetical protein